MMLRGKPSPSLNQTRGALLVVVATAVVGGMFLWNSRNAPVRSRIDAGITYLANGQLAAAQSQWQEATQLDPQNTQAWELLGDLYFNTKDYKAAQNAFAHAVESGSDSAGVEAKAAVSALQLQDLKSARRFGEAALKRNGNDIEALKVLAEVEKKENHPDAQLKLLQRLVDLQPQDGQALLTIATELALNKNFKELLPVAQKLVQVEPDATTSYFLRGLSYFNAEPSSEADKQAEADFRKAAELEPADGESHRFLARLYMRQNQPPKAIEEYKKIESLRPYSTVHLFEMSQALRLVGKTQESQQKQALFYHLKQVNQQMFSLTERTGLFPKDPAPCLQLTKLLLGCLSGPDADFQLYRYRYLNKQMPNVGESADRTMSIARPNTPAKAIGLQVETTYASYLRQAQEKLGRRDFVGANKAMARAMLIRPNDDRTSRALALFTTAGQDPLGALLPASPNLAFFD